MQTTLQERLKYKNGAILDIDNIFKLTDLNLDKTTNKPCTLTILNAYDYEDGNVKMRDVDNRFYWRCYYCYCCVASALWGLGSITLCIVTAVKSNLHPQLLRRN